MIPFEELVAALDRYKRRKAGQPVEQVAPRGGKPSSGKRPGAEAAELAVDELLDEI